MRGRSNDGSQRRTPPAPVQNLVALDRVRDVEEPGLVRLDRNERVQPLPDWFLDRIRAGITDELLTSYPATEDLYRELSKSLGIDGHRVVLTSGSDAAVKAIYHAWLRPGDAVVMLDPSYAMYRVYAEMFQAHAVAIPYTRKLDIDAAALLDSVVPGVRLVMIANPNQPTGTLLDESLLAELLERTADVDALVAVDEAYFPFSAFTVLSWIDRFPQLIVTRTFSKAAGLAGLRVGFAVGHPDVVSYLWKVRSAHDVNAVAILCAREILRNPQVVHDYVREVARGKEVLESQVGELGLSPLPTHANFALIRVAHRCTPEKLIAALRDRGYLVKGPFSAECLSDCIRVTLGPPALMAEFAAALEESLQAVG